MTPPKEDPVPVVDAAASLIVPALPMFSQAAVAFILKVHRGTVHNWLAYGKILSITDSIGERYVLRDELVRFAREYLKKDVKN